MRFFISTLRSCRWVDPLLLCALGAWLAHVSWAKWANIMVDFGRELYTPWRITCGDVLYRDIASLFGPLPPYWNALLFAVFGTSLKTLVMFNMAVVAVITFLVYRFFHRTAGRWAGLMCAAAFLCLFAFKQHYYDQGNRAFLCPYSYSVTYGFLLSLCAVSLFSAYCRSSRVLPLLAMGGCAGLVMLCRLEIALALVPALGIGMGLKIRAKRWSAGRAVPVIALTLAAAALPIGAAYIYFAGRLPSGTVFSSILGYNAHWGDVLRNFYYLHMAGLDQPVEQARRVAVAAGAYGLIVVALLWLCRGTRQMEQGRAAAGIAGIAAGAVVIYGLMVLAGSVWQRQSFLGLPVFVLAVIGVLLRRVWRRPAQDAVDTRLLPLLVMALWAGGLLCKVALNAQIYDVGFVHTLPAVLLFVAGLTAWVPAWCGRWYGKEALARALGIVLCLFMFFTVAVDTYLACRARTVPAGSPGEVLLGSHAPYSSVGSRAVGEFLRDVPRLIGPDAPFVVFPEGVMLNYFLRRPSPVPYVTFMPAEMIAYGEATMLRSLEQAAPPYIVYTNRSLYYFGFLGPGIDYARDMNRWILSHYRPVWRSQADNGFTLTLLKRQEGG